MIKIIVKWYLKRLSKDLSHQIESLDMELGYNKDLSNEDAEVMADLVDNFYNDRRCIRYVLNNVL